MKISIRVLLSPLSSFLRSSFIMRIAFALALAPLASSRMIIPHFNYPREAVEFTREHDVAVIALLNNASSVKRKKKIFRAVAESETGGRQRIETLRRLDRHSVNHLDAVADTDCEHQERHQYRVGVQPIAQQTQDTQLPEWLH